MKDVVATCAARWDPRFRALALLQWPRVRRLAVPTFGLPLLWATGVSLGASPLTPISLALWFLALVAALLLGGRVFSLKDGDGMDNMLERLPVTSGFVWWARLALPLLAVAGTFPAVFALLLPALLAQGTLDASVLVFLGSACSALLLMFASGAAAGVFLPRTSWAAGAGVALTTPAAYGLRKAVAHGWFPGVWAVLAPPLLCLALSALLLAVSLGGYVWLRRR